jgi:DNA-binding ferritin-like protein
MAEPTQPLSIRLATSDIDHLAERARRISGTPTGVARELIRSGLTDGDPFTQAERLLKISQDLQSVAKTSNTDSASLARLESMFDALLAALSGQAQQHRGSHE